MHCIHDHRQEATSLGRHSYASSWLTFEKVLSCVTCQPVVKLPLLVAKPPLNIKQHLFASRVRTGLAECQANQGFWNAERHANGDVARRAGGLRSFVQKNDKGQHKVSNGVEIKRRERQMCCWAMPVSRSTFIVGLHFHPCPPQKSILPNVYHPPGQ